MSKSIFTTPTPAYRDFVQSIEKHPWRHTGGELSVDIGGRSAGPQSPPPMFPLVAGGKSKPEAPDVRHKHLSRNQRHLL